MSDVTVMIEAAKDDAPGPFAIKAGKRVTVREGDGTAATDGEVVSLDVAEDGKTVKVILRTLDGAPFTFDSAGS